jgi:triacylglycerol lipase
VVSPLGSFLCPPGFAGPTGLRALVREGGSVPEAARLVRRGARLRRPEAPCAPPLRETALDPVVLVPGLLAGDGSLALMSRALRRAGYRTYRSAIRVNIGCSRVASDALEQRIEAIACRRGRKVTIVGHSLGGLLARVVAGRRPDLVDGIVTLGSPILAPGAAHPVLLFDLWVITALRRAGLGSLGSPGRVMGADCTSGDCARASWEQARVPLAREVSFTSVYSRRDGVVDWRSCLDPEAAAVEVATSHVGMVFDPLVLDTVVLTLAAHREARRRGLDAARGRRVSRRARSAAAPDALAG